MTSKLVFALAFACLPLVALAGGNVADGQKKAETCKACHGDGGAKPTLPEYPVLAGQHADYLAAALNQYKSGKRKNAIMTGFTTGLSPKDINDLAAYFAAQKSNLKNKY